MIHDGFGKNGMSPGFDEDVTYGLSVTGLAHAPADALPVVLAVDTTAEPCTRSGDAPIDLTGTVTVSGAAQRPQGRGFIPRLLDGAVGIEARAERDIKRLDARRGFPRLQARLPAAPTRSSATLRAI